MTKILFFSSFIFLFLMNTSYGETSFVPQERIKDIRVWAQETGESYTCVDEYLKRRKQLAIKMGLTPVVLPGSVVVGFVGGAYGGVGLFKLSGLPNGNYADLAALALGAMAGTVGSFGVAMTEEISAFVGYFKNQHLLRVIYESHHEGGEALDQWYADFKRHSSGVQLSKEEFKSEISQMDQDGKLCDGSLVRPRRYKKGTKLKQRLATKKEIFKALEPLKGKS